MGKDNDKNNILKETLTEDFSEESFFDKFINLFLLAFIAVLTFILLSIKSVDQWFIKEIPRHDYRIFAKALILGIIIFITQQIIIDRKLSKYQKLNL